LLGDEVLLSLETFIKITTYENLAKSFNEMTNCVQASEKSQHDFIANASHDLKTTLTSTQGFTQAILDSTVDTPEAIQRSAGVIQCEVRRMYHMVLDLLELARPDSGAVRMNKETINFALYRKGNLILRWINLYNQSACRKTISLDNL
jgi:signal transduction histidine kinase